MMTMMKKILALSLALMSMSQVAYAQTAVTVTNPSYRVYENSDSEVTWAQGYVQRCRSAGGTAENVDQGTDSNGQYVDIRCNLPATASSANVNSTSETTCVDQDGMTFTVQSGETCPTYDDPATPANGTPATRGSGSTPTPTGNTTLPSTGTSGTGSTVTQSSPTSVSSGGLNYVPLEPLPSVSQYENGAPGSLVPLLSGILMLCIILGGMLAVARFSIGGVIFMTSDVAGNRAHAKSQMWASVWGLLLLICSVLILRTINPGLVNFNFVNDLSGLSGTGNYQNTGGTVI